MELIFACSKCQKNTKHVVIASAQVKNNFETKLKCMHCIEPVFRWITPIDNNTAMAVYRKFNKI